MGSITITKKQMDDSLDFAVVRVTIASADEIHDTLAKRVVVTSEYRFSASIGQDVGSSTTTYLNEHVALTPTERATFRTLIKKIYDYDVDNDDLA